MQEENQKSVLVTGATGHVGSEVVKALLNESIRVRALVRDAEKASFPEDVEVFVGDLSQTESMGQALTGASALFIMAGYSNDKAFLSLAKEKGVSHVVLLSAGVASLEGNNNPIVAFNHNSEQAVKESGIAWTILRPSGFHANALRWLPEIRKDGIIHAQFSKVPIASIDPADIGAVAAQCITNPVHSGKTYRLTGPEALFPSQQVVIMNEVLDENFQCIDLDDIETKSALEATIPPQYVSAMMEFFEQGKGIYNDSRVTHDVEQALGRPARTFRQWVIHHKDEFRK